MNWKRTLLFSILILLAGGAVTFFIFTTEPTAVRSAATKETAMLVDVTGVERGAFQPTIEAMGTVVPSQEIILSPRVSGEITGRSDHFIPGGFVQKGDTLLQIDPSDYRYALQQRKSELQQALSDLYIEMGRQQVAKKEIEVIGDTLTEDNKALVLRQPQLNAVQARVESARAAVGRAELDLQRTTLTAPFDAHILNRNVNIGSHVAPGDNLGRLVGIDSYWIEATVPVSKLSRLTFPESHRQRGSRVVIRNRTAWEPGKYREGYLYKLVGALEDQTRMARVLISVPDPLTYRSDDSELPPLMIGAFVEVSIRAKELENVIRLSRDLIRKDDTVWIMENGVLNIRDVSIAFRDAQYAYITGGLNENDRVVTTNLATVVDGAPLRLSASEDTVPQDSLAASVQ